MPATSSEPVPEPPEALPRPVRVGGGFRNPERHEDRSLRDVLRWKLNPRSRSAPWPRHVPLEPKAAPPPPERDIAVTAVGHATFLIQTPSLTLLTDPVWSDRVGLLGLIGPRRVQSPGVIFESLPPIDVILLSHDHYDHCDLPTLRRLAHAHSRARLCTPLAHLDLARRAGFGAKRQIEFDWWKTVELEPGHRLTSTPARHWSNRISSKRNQRLWCGWHLATPDASLLFTGDTAYDATFFPAIRRHLGPPDLALIPVGAYAPRWFMREQHCDPAEAVQIHLDLGARRSLGMHWGTFPLTDEPRDEPPVRLAKAVAEAGLDPGAFVVAEPGASVRL